MNENIIYSIIKWHDAGFESPLEKSKPLCLLASECKDEDLVFDFVEFKDGEFNTNKNKRVVYWCNISIMDIDTINLKDFIKHK